METQAEFLSLLVCPSCRRRALDSQAPTRFHKLNAAVRDELLCTSCRSVFPIVDGIPVLFSDSRRIAFAVDEASKAKAVSDVADLNRQYVASHGAQRLRLSTDSEGGRVAWEYFFWNAWREHGDETGVLSGDRERLERHLRATGAVGGRLRFLEDVVRYEGSLDGKLLLNVGCGPDALLERVLDKGCRVIEQDIVLDSLAVLKRRGAAFCLCCDLAELPIAARSVDLATSSGVIHHVWPIARPLAHVMRVLKPGGGAYFVEPNAFALTTMVKMLVPQGVARLLRSMQRETKSPSPFERSINPFVMAGLLEKCGARKEDIHRSFRRDTWGTPPRAIKFVLDGAVRLFPVLSAHCFTAVRKSAGPGE
ncbi:MAG: methyltransferase domain-containing protein [Verrucomicrobia bacterium]|nr:methyltransferase domain-containing protein [Verrucomicrobiota bacterium]